MYQRYDSPHSNELRYTLTERFNYAMDCAIQFYEYDMENYELAYTVYKPNFSMVKLNFKQEIWHNIKVYERILEYENGL